MPFQGAHAEALLQQALRSFLMTAQTQVHEALGADCNRDNPKYGMVNAADGLLHEVVLPLLSTTPRRPTAHAWATALAAIIGCALLGQEQRWWDALNKDVTGEAPAVFRREFRAAWPRATHKHAELAWSACVDALCNDDGAAGGALTALLASCNSEGGKAFWGLATTLTMNGYELLIDHEAKMRRFSAVSAQLPLIQPRLPDSSSDASDRGECGSYSSYDSLDHDSMSSEDEDYA